MPTLFQSITNMSAAAMSKVRRNVTTHNTQHTAARQKVQLSFSGTLSCFAGTVPLMGGMNAARG